MDKLIVIILAAGKGKRLGLDIPKVILESSEMPIICHVLETALQLNPEKIVIVTGYQAELVEKTAASYFNTLNSKVTLEFAYQKEQLGTGDAARVAMSALKNFVGNVLILYGDAPLITSTSIKQLNQYHHLQKATISLISFFPPSPASYGRVIRNSGDLHIEKIIETKDCLSEELACRECNSGIYIIDSAFLAPALSKLKNHNSQSEYYLTDIVEQGVKEGQTVIAMPVTEPEEVFGVNTRYDLSLINAYLLEKRRRKVIEDGVILEDSQSFYIEKGVNVAPGVKIGAIVTLSGKTTIESEVVFEGSSYVSNTTIRRGSQIKFGVSITDSDIGAASTIGPFANISRGSSLAEEVHVGNFVELKNSTLSKKVKAKHLAYIGDTSIGEGSNIGAGTITCNYDGVKKSRTEIGKEVFVGSNSCLIAPLKIGDGAYVAAGSTINQEVPAKALAIAREKQTNKLSWKKKS